MMRFLLFIALLVWSQVNLPAQDFNVLDFGAIADGKTLNTSAIQSAVDSAHVRGGGRVWFPPGRFLSGSIILKSGVKLHLSADAFLLGSTKPEHYVKLKRWKALVIADGQNDIGITGHGEIDGQGRALALHIDSLFYAGQIDSSDYNFVEKRPKYYLRPQLIEFVGCKNIEVRNVTLRNAACWVQTHHECENIIIDSVRTESDAYWNNDGIDIQDCKNVRITNCYVNAADDGICLKSHGYRRYCEDIYIANCTVRSSASAIKFGTMSYGGFRNIRIEHIKVFDTFRSAVAIEAVDGGTLEKVVIDDVEATNTGNAIFIRLGNRKRLGNPKKEDAIRVSVLKDVTLKNFKVDVAYERPDYNYDLRGPALPFFHNTFPSSITGIPGHRVENVTLENIVINFPGRGNNGLAHMPLHRLEEVPEKVARYPEFSMFGELPAWGFYVRHVDGLQLKNLQLNLAAPDYRPPLVFDDVHNLSIDSLKITGDHKDHQIILHNTENVKIDSEHSVLKM